MHLCTIWHVSSGRTFPLDLQATPYFDLAVKEIAVKDLADVQPANEAFYLFFIQVEDGEMEAVRRTLHANRGLSDYPKIVLLPQADYAKYAKDLALIPHAIALDDSVRPIHLKTVLQLVLQQEYYRQVIYTMAKDTRQKNSAFEGLLDLARKELQTKDKTSAAYSSLLEYEASMHKFEEQIHKAQEQALNLKDQELLLLKDQLMATERLSDYRDLELQDVRAHFSAAEAALDLSRRENLERERIITAMDRLRRFTDKELVDLLEENQEFRRKLGLPPRDQ